MTTFFQRSVHWLACACMALSGLAPAAASAQTGIYTAASASSAVSLVPIASVVGAASVAAGAVVAIPAMLLVSGGVVVLRAVESSTRGVVYVLENASDGTRTSIEVVGASAVGASIVAGAPVTTSVIVAGVVLSVAGEVIAFLPNESGRALLHNERLTW